MEEDTECELLFCKLDGEPKKQQDVLLIMAGPAGVAGSRNRLKHEPVTGVMTLLRFLSPMVLLV